jgi:phosphoribosylformylglycinamidine synthase
MAFKAADEAILMIGTCRGWLGQSLYLRDICGREEGAPPPVDLGEERRNGNLVRSLIRDGLVTAVHDVSDGGLLVALAEMAMASGIGAVLEPVPQVAEHAFWFGEDQARYVITVRSKDARKVGERANGAQAFCRVLGLTGGDRLTLPGERPILVKILQDRHEGWLPAYMAGHET